MLVDKVSCCCRGWIQEDVVSGSSSSLSSLSTWGSRQTSGCHLRNGVGVQERV